VASVRRLAAIMFTDMVGYSAAAQTDEAGTLRRLHDHEQLLRPVIGTYGGREVKSTGDGFLVEFDSALRATECALEIQRVLREHNSGAGRVPIEIRIGIHLGDVEERGGDIFGDAVNIASRAEPASEPGGICITGSVFEQVRNKIPNRIERLPPTPLKNLKNPVDLYRITMPPTARESTTAEGIPNRLAVLPLVNFSPDPNDAYFADGLTEELITLISQLPEIRVIARTSVFQYKATTKTVAQIGAELGVSSILEGSVRKSRDQVRITVQLVDAASEEHLWANTYDRKLDDIFVVQSEVAKRIAKALKINLKKVEESRMDTPPTVASESYLAYLKGRALLSGLASESQLRSALERFEEAVAIDPKNARAHSGLADAAMQLVWNHLEPDRKAGLEKVRRHVTLAMELDPNLAESHCSLANLVWNDNDTAAVERELKRAISLNPSYSYARLQYAYLLREQGRPDQAWKEYSIVEVLDPQSTRALFSIIEFLCEIRRMNEAKPRIERMERIAPASPDYHAALAWYYFASSEYGRCLEEIQSVQTLGGYEWYTGNVQAWVYALLGQRERARELLRRAEAQGGHANDPSTSAIGYALAGDLDDAFRLLFGALDRGVNVSLAVIRLDPTLEALRADPRFSRVLTRMNLA